jgi:structural maintenance of chromosome 3 (chondroitin sulfate proteoglycan 6)
LWWNEKRKRRECLLRVCNHHFDSPSLDITQSKLQVLYAKQGRAQQFTTQAARDRYLNDEIKSLKAYEKAQQTRVDDLKKDVEGAKAHLADAMARSEEGRKGDDERRERLKTMGEEIARLRSQIEGLQEQRK